MTRRSDDQWSPALRGRKALIVASTGGHLAQAVRWQKRLDLADSSLFVTFDSPQSRSLVDHRPHVFVPYVAPRDWRGVMRTARIVTGIQKDFQADALLSTGAGVGLSCLLPSALHRTPLFYIESVSRFDGPSSTGRALQYVPWVQRGTQHPSWADRRWPYVGSLLDDYAIDRGPLTSDPRSGLKIFITLGTIRPYRFDRLIDRMLEVIEPNDTVVWQLGATDRDGLPGHASSMMSADEYRAAACGADVVVTHAGVGAILDLFNQGISPVVVPRLKQFGEHVDDHQQQAAAFIADSGLAISCDASSISRDALLRRGRVVLQPGS